MSTLSDEALYDRFGDIIHEIPELATSLRLSELQKRPMVITGAFKFTSDWVTVSSASEQVLTRLKPANSR